MRKFTGSLAALQAWVLLGGIEGQWANDSEFTSSEGAKLTWTSATGALDYSGDQKAVRKLRAALERKQDSKGLKLLLWLAVSVGFALLPVAANYINGRSSGKSPNWIDLLAGGELFLIGAALTADGIGRAFLGGERNRGFRIICGTGCALLLAATSVYYAKIAFSLEEQRIALRDAIQARNLDQIKTVFEHPGIDRTVTSTDSLWLFCFALIASFGITLVEED